MSRIGGKWHKGKKCHLFPYDPSPLLRAVVSSGELPEKNPTAFFPTPRNLVNRLIEVTRLCEYTEGRILEPSAGTGAIAQAIKAASPLATLDCCEFLGVNRTALIDQGFQVVAEDFTAYQPDESYRAILMNPPFSLADDSQAYITHFNHAWSMLDHRGRIAAIVPTGWLSTQTKKVSAFRDFVSDNLDFELVEAGAFKESGTMVATAIIYGEKEDQPWRRKPHHGWHSYHGWHTGLWMDNDRTTYERKSKNMNREEFKALCESAADHMRRKDWIPTRLDDQDIEDLWQHYKDD